MFVAAEKLRFVSAPLQSQHEYVQLQIALFAGRRSSDRAYLLLQTWFCAHHLKNYIGSSSIFAFSHLSRALEEQGVHKPEKRIEQMGRA